MKALILAIAIFGLLVLCAPNLWAQLYGPYYGPYGDAQYQQYLQYQHYLQWQQYLDYLRQTDPYYDLHIMHYQLYLRPYQAFQTYPPAVTHSAYPRGQRRVAMCRIRVEVEHHRRLGEDRAGSDGSTLFPAPAKICYFDESWSCQFASLCPFLDA